MQNQTTNKILFFCFFAILVACSRSELENKPNTLSSEMITTVPVATANQVIVSATPSPNKIIPSPISTQQGTATSQVMASSQSTNTPTVLLRDDCPALLEPNQQPLWTTGSILYESDGSVWAIPANSLTSYMIFSIESEGGFFEPYIEHGASKLLMSDFLRPEGNFYIVYDLADRSQIKVPIESVTPPIPLDGQHITWLPDNRVKFLINLERVEGVGETRTFQIIDLTTGQIETVTEELNLPDYGFYRNAMYFGFASVDPTNQIVLYTTMGESDSSGLTLILRQLDSGNLLWKQEGSFWASWPIPDVQWDDDGSSFLFSSELNGYSQPFGFLSVQSNGVSEILPPQPFPLTDQWHQINSINRSPEGRYINYHLGATPGQGFETGPGVVVDTVTLQAGTICEVNSEKSSEFYGGKWISETIFLYRMKTRDGFMSLRILDVTTWSTQILAELVAKPYYDNAYGWTPVEFPEP